MKVNTHNHWDPIEEIFVGIADNAMLPTMNRSVRSFSYADYDPESIKDLQGPVDKKIIEEANEEAEYKYTIIISIVRKSTEYC